MSGQTRSRRHLLPKSLAVLGCFLICVAAWFKAERTRSDASARLPELYRVVDARLRVMRAHDATDADPLSRWLREADLRSSRRVEFGAARQNGDRAEVDLFFIRRNAQVVPCAFDLVRGGDGGWKVENARFLDRSEANGVARSLRI